MYSVIGSDGQVYGPIDIPTLQRWVQEGRVIATTNLIDAISGKVIQAQYATELMGSFQSTPPVQTPTQSPGAGVGGAYQQYPRTHSANINLNINANPYVHPAYYRSAKSKTVAILLAFFLGGLGIHRFYLGHNSSGLAMLLLTVLTCGWGGIITGIWAIVDIIQIANNNLTDISGMPLS